MLLQPNNNKNFLKGKFMKTKRLAGLLIGLLSIGVLASCNSSGGNPEGEAKALSKVLDGGIASIASSGSPLLAQEGDNKNENSLSGNDNDALSVTVKQVTKVNNVSYTVELEWTWAEEYNEVISLSELEGDEYHKKMSFVYPGESDKENTTASFKVTGKCGSSTSERTFNVILVKPTIKYDEVTIASLYEANSDNTNFNIVDTSTGYIKGNYNQKYYYIAVSGKVIYVAADQNWALIADGKDVLQLYRVDASSDKELVTVGNYIKVWGNMSNGYGNLQLAFVTKVEILEDHSKIADFVEQEIPNGLNNTKDDKGFRSFFSGISNAVTTFTGTANSTITFTGKARATLKLNLDGAEGNYITIAYDYHVGTPDKSKLNETGEAYKKVFDQVKKGTKLKIRGTMRWSSDSGTNVINAKGHWTITPFDLTDVALA